MHQTALDCNADSFEVRIEVDRERGIMYILPPAEAKILKNSHTKGLPDLPTEASIRLLSINAPKVLDSDSTIAITLQAYELDKVPPFKALSYTWGNAYRELFIKESTEMTIPSQFITRNGIRTPVTQNLYDALSHLSQAESTDLFWIDALCIDQLNDEERASQVLLMGDIYRQATQVVVWLGPHKAGIEELIWVLTEFLDTFEDVDSPFKEVEMAGKLTSIFEQKDHLTAAFNFLASCRWFSRAWITQEVLLARDVEMLCGQTKIPWSRLWRFSTIINYTGIKPLLGDSLDADSEGIEYVFRWSSLSSWQKLRLEAGIPQSTNPEREEEAFFWLWNCLNVNRMSECTNSLDYVYSVLGFASAHFRNHPVKYYIQPVYDITAKDLFTTVSKLILKHNMACLDVLGSTGERSEELDALGLPTWVTNFSKPNTMRAQMINMGPTGSGIPYFNPAADLYANGADIQFDENKLVCSGVCFDIIEDILTPIKTDYFEDLNWEPSFRFCLPLSKTVYKEKLIEVLWRTLILNNDGNTQYPAPPSIGFSFLHCIALLAATRVYRDTEDVDTEGKFDVLADLATQLGLEEDAATGLANMAQNLCMGQLILALLESGQLDEQAVSLEDQTSYKDELKACDENSYEFTILASAHTAGRQLFRTKSGLLGSGPNNMEIGDEVYLLPSAHILFVLRPKPGGEEKILVGECYVHGVMHGEMLDEPWNLRDKIMPITIV